MPVFFCDYFRFFVFFAFFFEVFFVDFRAFFFVAMRLKNYYVNKRNKISMGKDYHAQHFYVHKNVYKY